MNLCSEEEQPTVLVSPSSDMHEMKANDLVSGNAVSSRKTDVEF